VPSANRNHCILEQPISHRVCPSSGRLNERMTAGARRRLRAVRPPRGIPAAHPRPRHVGPLGGLSALHAAVGHVGADARPAGQPVAVRVGGPRRRRWGPRRAPAALLRGPRRRLHAEESLLSRSQHCVWIHSGTMCCALVGCL